MKVHITVDKELRHDKQAMTRLMDLIVTTSEIQGANSARFLKFAVLSGDIDPKKIAEIEKLGGVIAVEPDEERFLL